jgi:hypothetical protein
MSHIEDFYFIAQNTRRLEPILTPLNPILTAGSDIVIQCDRPSFDDIDEPDNYFWLKSYGKNETIKNVLSFDQLVLLNQSEANQNQVKSEFIYNGKILQLRNITSKHQAWYFCCLIYNHKTEINEYDVGHDSSKEICSSTFLTVKIQFNNKDNKNWLLVLLISIFVVTILVIMLAVFLISLYNKRKRKYAIPSIRKFFKEVSLESVFEMIELIFKTTFKNRIYRSSNQNENNSMSTKSSVLNSLSNEKNFNSIQNMLENSDALKYKILMENIKFGHILGKFS